MRELYECREEVFRRIEKGLKEQNKKQNINFVNATFKNKKFLSLLLFCIATILSFVLIIPNVIPINNDTDKISEKQNDKNTSQNLITPNTSESTVTEDPKDPIAQNPEQNDTQQNSTPSATTNDNSNDTPSNNIGTFYTGNDNIDDEIIKIKSTVVTFLEKTFNYSKTENVTGRVNSINFYYSKDGAELQLDSVTNEIIKFNLKSSELTAKPLKAANEDEMIPLAKKIAKKFNNDFDKYNSIERNKLGTKNHLIVFRRTIKDYKTAEYVAFQFDTNYNMIYYYHSPNAFDGIDTSNITVDKDAINKQIEEMYIKLYGDKYNSFEISSQILTVKNSKVILEVSTSALDKSGNQLSQGTLMLSEFEVG